MSARARWLLLLLAVAIPAGGARAQKTCADADVVVIRGAVRNGEAFEHTITSELLFRLNPTSNASPLNPQGWTIEVESRRQPDHELSYPVSPP